MLTVLDRKNSGASRRRRQKRAKHVRVGVARASCAYRARARLGGVGDGAWRLGMMLRARMRAIEIFHLGAVCSSAAKRLDVAALRRAVGSGICGIMRRRSVWDNSVNISAQK